MADQSSQGLLSPYLRKKRFEAVGPWINGRILDVGCGTGLFAKNASPQNYYGVDVDEFSLSLARQKFPKHTFSSKFPSKTFKFDTIVSLAVIEHVPDPAIFLYELAEFLADSDSARIVITTPHPSVDFIHDIGSKIGLFSSHASDEHEDLLNYESLVTAGSLAGLQLEVYSRFLFRANQVAVYSKKRA